MKPKITFITNNKQKEAEYICFLAKNITRSHYQNGGMVVLPYPVKNTKSVFFPDIGYSPKFWQAIRKSKSTDFAVKYPKSAVDEIAGKLTLNSIDQKVHNKISKWYEIEQDFLELASQYFGNSGKFNKLRSVEILATSYGTFGSWHIFYSKGGYDIKFTWRNDLSYKNIARTLLMAFYTLALGQKTEVSENYWYQRNAVVNFLLKYSQLARFAPILKSVNSNTSVIDSDNYLAKLGFPTSQIFTIINNKLTILNKNLDVILTKQEYDLFELLHSKQNTLVKLEEIAGIIWGSAADDKFSLYAIAKVIENIRKKIRLQGINKETIITVRSKGYLLIN